jgi:hypothetical protein
MNGWCFDGDRDCPFRALGDSAPPSWILMTLLCLHQAARLLLPTIQANPALRPGSFSNAMEECVSRHHVVQCSRLA